jgi:hypothetical protein
MSLSNYEFAESIFPANWSYAQIIVLAGFAFQGVVNKDHIVWLRSKSDIYDLSKVII